jgi:hypothetical protein
VSDGPDPRSVGSVSSVASVARCQTRWLRSPCAVKVRIDTIIHDETGVSERFLCELKWCHDLGTLGWTLWDIYKMVAARRLEGVWGCYVVAGAPESFWESEEHCAPLFTNGTWRSLDLFQRFGRIGQNCW